MGIEPLLPKNPKNQGGTRPFISFYVGNSSTIARQGTGMNRPKPRIFVGTHDAPETVPLGKRGWMILLMEEILHHLIGSLSILSHYLQLFLYILGG